MYLVKGLLSVSIRYFIQWLEAKQANPQNCRPIFSKCVSKTDNSKELLGVNFNCIFRQDVSWGVLNLVTRLSFIATRITNMLFNELAFGF